MRNVTASLFASLFLFCACNNDQQPAEPTESNLLPTSLVKNPHSANGLDSAAVSALPTMDFRDTVFDFGTIREGEVVTRQFEFTNNGKSPLVISNSSASCGCTVADFPHEPLAPGKSASISVSFNSAGKPGHQEKSVSLTTNTVRGVHMLYIKGDVKEK